MDPVHPPFWAGLFRNRRGVASCACLVLVGGWAGFLGNWIARCCWDKQWYDWHPGQVAGLTLLSGLHTWLSHLDARYPDPGQAAGPSPN